VIALVDYGMGNLRSVEKALRAVGAEVQLATAPQQIERARAVVLPGVGAIGDCVCNLTDAQLVPAIKACIAGGKPFLGICLGLQALFDESEESGGVKGLGVFPGTVPRFRVTGLKVPHMGWNKLTFQQPNCPLLQGVEQGSFVYFVHSYFVAPKDRSLVCTTTDYGGAFCSMIWRDNVYATQFHPEKSQAVGLKMLENFVALVEGVS
jgi:glutamine amidotransferase